ncbi:MAG: polymorphic toxin-type HINT domain-containing protein [Eubacteriales bacterium]|nr:polymorphic toxin-type HINT domain-containing protein [Eubacteriales bacterium]
MIHLYYLLIKVVFFNIICLHITGYLSNEAKIAIGAGVIALALILSVATAGAASGTLLSAVHCFAVGAFNGVVIGATTGALSGAAMGGIIGGLSTGSWEGAWQGAIDGAADGFMWGSITGFVSGGLTSNVCFVAGTSILTSSGLVAIENIKEGDLVWSKNPATGEKALKHVVQTFISETDELVHIFVNGEEIVTTPEHPFWEKNREWCSAIEIRAGDILVLANGETAVVEKTSYEKLDSVITVYNFEVEDFCANFVSEDKFKNMNYIMNTMKEFFNDTMLIGDDGQLSHTF